jgi:hypothetical protein
MGRYRSTCVDLSVGVLLIAVVWVPKFVGRIALFVVMIRSTTMFVG